MNTERKQLAARSIPIQRARVLGFFQLAQKHVQISVQVAIVQQRHLFRYFSRRFLPQLDILLRRE